MKISIITGVIIAIAGTSLMLILLATDLVGPDAVNNDHLMYGGTILFTALYLFLLIGLFICLQKVKRLNGNKLTLIESVKTGFITSLTASVVSVIFTLVFYELIFPDYNEQMVSSITEKLSEAGVNQISMNNKIREQTQYYSTSNQAKFAFAGNLITGLAFTFLLGLILKTGGKTSDK